MSIETRALGPQFDGLTMPAFLTERRPEARTRPLAAYRHWALVSDAVVVIIATVVGYTLRFGVPESVADSLAQPVIPLVMALWMVALFARGCYDQRLIGVGTEEFKRLVSATILVFAMVAGLSYLIQSETSRVFLFIALPLGLGLLIAERWLLRRVLYRQRAAGRASHRTLILGTPERAAELAAVLSKDTYAGYKVVASLEPPDSTNGHVPQWLAHVTRVLEDTNADAVAVTPSTHLNSDIVRKLAWAIEGRGIDLLVAPALGDVAGPRITMRPAAGLPLIHLEEPGLSAAQSLAKRSIDLLGAVLGLVLVSPLLLAIAVSIKATSRGPVLFTQWRIGQNGEPFRILKFRTMHEGADAQREALRAQCGHDDPAFKMTDDPRVTRVGRFLRRWSLDELPQLVNVVRNDMSLVGPRPHPVDDVARYVNDDFRRLLAKPGMTGLWQVTGRSNVEWAEAVQLDLYYVENWSFSGDVVLLARTARAVLGGHGAA